MMIDLQPTPQKKKICISLIHTVRIQSVPLYEFKKKRLVHLGLLVSVPPNDRPTHVDLFYYIRIDFGIFLAIFFA